MSPAKPPDSQGINSRYGASERVAKISELSEVMANNNYNMSIN